jgi:hypothetical protein
MDTTTERQRRYRERLYKAGFKQIYVWIRRKEGKTPVKMSVAEFVRLLKKQTAGTDGESLTRLLNLLLKIAKGRTEEVKLREKKK